MRVYALLNIPERCALVGGMITLKASSLLGTTTTISVYTEYGTVWEKTVTAGKSYFIPMLIAPQSGMTLFLGIGIEPIIPGPIIKGAKSGEADEVTVTLPNTPPKILFSGRLMVPSEVYLDWRKVQVHPAEVTAEAIAGQEIQ